jgi:hypothetical protein
MSAGMRTRRPIGHGGWPFGYCLPGYKKANWWIAVNPLGGVAGRRNCRLLQYEVRVGTHLKGRADGPLLQSASSRRLESDRRRGTCVCIRGGACRVRFHRNGVRADRRLRSLSWSHSDVVYGGLRLSRGRKLHRSLGVRRNGMSASLVRGNVLERPPCGGVYGHAGCSRMVASDAVWTRRDRSQVYHHCRNVDSCDCFRVACHRRRGFSAGRARKKSLAWAGRLVDVDDYRARPRRGSSPSRQCITRPTSRGDCGQRGHRIHLPQSHFPRPHR